ncbi:MAG: TSUP family transporter [Acidobacteriota bacterium]
MIALALIATLAFAVEGALGFGATVIAATLGAEVVPLAQLVPAFVPINLALSAYLAVRGRRAIAWRVVVELVPPAGLGAALGIAMFRPGRALELALAGFVVALAALELLRPAARPLATWPRRALLVAAGTAHGLFGTGGPLVVYVAGRRLAPHALRATLAVLWLALNAALVASYAQRGLYDRATLRLVVVFAAALPAGVALASRVRVSPRAVWLVLLAAGALLAARALT